MLGILVVVVNDGIRGVSSAIQKPCELLRDGLIQTS